nr:hypothetical protein [Tanacetum cinerariifolium]
MLKKPDNSLSMGDEHLDTVLVTESDEFIKSSVENLVPNPSESEGEYEYIPKEIYSNPLFDEEIISMKIDPRHFNVESGLIESLLDHDSSIISSFSKIDSLFDEFAGELTLLKSIPPRINETHCDPEEETRLIKILLYDNSSLHDPMPPGIEEDDYDSERDILILEEFLSNDSFSLPENESFHFDIPSSSRPPTKPPYGNSGTVNVKVMGDISEHKDSAYADVSSLLDIPSQQETPQTQSPSIQKVPVSVIPETTNLPPIPELVTETPVSTTVPSPQVTPIISTVQQTPTPIPTPQITTDASTITTAVPESNALTTVELRKSFPFYSSRLIPKLRFDFPYSASLGHDPDVSSLLDIPSQQETPQTQSPSIQKVPVSVIPETTNLPPIPELVTETPVSTTVSSPQVTHIISTMQQTPTPIPTPQITTDASTITTAVPESNALTTVKLRHLYELTKRLTPTAEQESKKSPSDVLKIKKEQAEIKDHKKKHDDDDEDNDAEDPPAGPNQGKKTKRRITKESESSKKQSTTKETPKGKNPTKSSKTRKSASKKEPVEEPIAEVIMDDAGDDVVRHDDQPQAAFEPKIHQWPDLIFVVCMCARYYALPTKKHIEAIKRVFWLSRYPEKYVVKCSVSWRQISDLVIKEVEKALLSQPQRLNTLHYKMVEENVLAPAPTRSDEQILPFNAWLPVGKGNLLLDLYKLQKNPIFRISVLEITPVDSAHPFESPLAGEKVMDFVNELSYPEEIHFVSKMHV